MNPRQKIVLAGACAILAAVAGYEASILAGQRTDLRTLQQQSRQLSAEITSLTVANDAPPPGSAPTDRPGSGAPAAATDENPTLSHVRQLKQFFADSPARQIPELQLLSHLDWLDVATGENPIRSHTPLRPDELRFKAEVLRFRAKEKFARSMLEALDRYQRENLGALPADLAPLAQFFASPPDPAILARYRVVRSGPTESLSPDDRIVEERSLADEEYDRRLYFTAFIAWNSESSAHTLNSVVTNATWEFAKANRRKPSTPAQLLPYLQADEKKYHGLPELQRFWSSPLRRDPLPQIADRDEIQVREKAEGEWTAEIVTRR